MAVLGIKSAPRWKAGTPPNTVASSMAKRTRPRVRRLRTARGSAAVERGFVRSQLP